MRNPRNPNRIVTHHAITSNQRTALQRFSQAVVVGVDDRRGRRRPQQRWCQPIGRHEVVRERHMVFDNGLRLPRGPQIQIQVIVNDVR